MTPQKKQKTKSLQDVHNSIMDLLSTIKPQLQAYLKGSGPESTGRDLQKVANLAETFAETRSKGGKALAPLFDALDQEGVNLWNISSVIDKGDGDEHRTQVSNVRYAAFRLIEAGMEAKPSVETLLHIVQTASKTGLSLAEAGNIVIAGSVLTTAAKFEEMLRNACTSDDVHQRPVASATAMYLCSRMELAWKEGNLTLAEFMSKKIVEDAQRVSLLSMQVRKYLAVKLHNVGKSLLSDSAKKPSDAVEWLQRAFTLLDKLPEDALGTGIVELKISILRTLARAYFVAGSYDRSEAVLDELIPAVDASGNNANPEYQELRWLRLTVLKRRKAPESVLLDAYKTIVDHSVWSEDNVTDILQDLRTLSTLSTLVAEVHKHCIRRAVNQKEAEEDFVDRLTLSIILHCSKEVDHSTALKILDEFFTLLSETGIDLGRVAITACLSLLWQSGGRHYKAKKWSHAADWYLVGTHAFFKKGAPSGTYKCLRKAALCYIEQHEYIKASTVIRRCPPEEATTQYIIFLTAFYQGLEDEAIRAVKEMQAAPDFDRNMLLLATQICHRSEQKRVLLSVLEALLKTLKLGSSEGMVVEAMALLRCIIKLILGRLVDPLANRRLLIDTLVSHFRTAKILALSALEQKAVSIIQKDVSWLWRTAYNCAVQGCSEWEGCGEQISELFDMARILLDVCWKATPLDIDKESCIFLINSVFAAVTGRVFSTRETMTTAGSFDAQSAERLIDQIHEAKAAIGEVLSKNLLDHDKDGRADYMLHVLRVFEMEFLVHLKEWDRVSTTVKEVIKSGQMAVGTSEAVADLLWVAADCPIQVLQESLEGILSASLEIGSLSVERFSRWLRAICTIVLVRNNPEDRTKAFGYFEQAISVIQDNDNNTKDTYPIEERQWLLATAYNTATECFHASLIDEAKRWFETAISICRFVPGGKERSKKISETYTQLLAKYRTG
ncbi:meiosis protein SPO22/ZIP4 like-domain-containing protein [Coprinopsis sp. MPI-PUGE-AT-0042]|nr:meiosis protein SPO22/ZIP4 like-domain-containing protein [Coprinopsis sp. MPI-PUGE-AT-0042]